MSNHLAIATVSAALAHILRAPVQADVDGAFVWTDRPPTDGDPAGPEVRIFLYAVQPNAAWRNADLPTRSPNGDLVQRPQAALDLHYLISFYGDERALVPQRLLGTVARELHARPLLSRETILQMIEAEVGTDPGFPLATADLAEQPERVRFAPLALTLEEMSQLWSVFFQAPYRLSMAYLASVVLVTPDDPPRPVLPVHERRIVTVPILNPTIERVIAAAGALEPVVMGTPLLIQGSQLRGEITAVWFGAERVTPPQSAIGDREIRVTPPATARAGTLGVRVEHRLLLGDPPAERAAGSSNIVPLILRPRIRQVANLYQVSASGVVADGALRSGTIDVTVDPAVGTRQRVVLNLGQRNPAAGAQPASYSFLEPSRDLPGAAEATNDLSVPFTGVLAGSYVVRVEVDGAESPLDRDTTPGSPTFEQYTAPEVTIA